MKIRIVGLAPLEEYLITEQDGVDLTFPCPRTVPKRTIRSIGLAGKLALHLSRLGVGVELITEDDLEQTISSTIKYLQRKRIEVRPITVSNVVKYKYYSCDEVVFLNSIERNYLSKTSIVNIDFDGDPNLPLVVFGSKDWKIKVNNKLIPENNLFIGYGQYPENKFNFGFFHSRSIVEVRKESELSGTGIISILKKRYQFEDVCILHPEGLSMSGVAKNFHWFSHHTVMYLMSRAVFYHLGKTLPFKKSVYKAIEDLESIEVGRDEFLSGL